MIFEVRGQGTSNVFAYGIRPTRSEAETLLKDSQARVARAGGKIERWWIEEIDTSDLFPVPSRPTPRERFTTRVQVTSAPNAWTQVRVDVVDGDRVIATYDRNYSMLQTFEPFRQGDGCFALISSDYTATSVLDLRSGQVIASETPSPGGFCPVGFYVPDWWDVNDGSVLPGSLYWRQDKEWPSAGDFGFVWGCIWGDDSSLKVQYLDLSQIQRGRIQRMERFGYLRLASRPDAHPKEFIRLSSWEGTGRVEFRVEETFDLDTGRKIDPFDL